MNTNNIEQEILDELSAGMQSQIDFEIISDVLVKSGWTKVQLERFKDNSQAVDIMGWCHDTLRHRWQRRGTVFVFESAKEASWFILRWS